MRRFKRVNAVASAAVLTFSSLMSLGLGGIAHAAVQTCTWTGATNDNFNNAGNWSGCGSGVPAAGDNLVFDNTSLTEDTTLTNDMTSLSIGSITFQGDESPYSYTLTGNAMTLSGGITAPGVGYIDTDLTLSADQTFTGSSILDFGSYDTAGDHTINMSGHTLTLGGAPVCGGVAVFDALSGSGSIVATNTNGVILGTDNSDYTGTITVNAGSTLYANGSHALGANSAALVVNSGASLTLGFDNNVTYANPITLSGTGVDGGQYYSY